MVFVHNGWQKQEYVLNVMWDTRLTRTTTKNVFLKSDDHKLIYTYFYQSFIIYNLKKLKISYNILIWFKSKNH